MFKGKNTMNKVPPIMEVGGVLISSDILTECFCCDYEKCKGICCVEGDAGAPVTMDEIAGIEDALDTVWADLSASAQSVIDHQGVAYTDKDGDLVTSIVRGKDCVFTCYEVTTACAPWNGPIARERPNSANPSAVRSIPFVRKVLATGW